MSFVFDRRFKFLLGALVFLFFLISVQDVYTLPPLPGEPNYSVSAHGNTSYGVQRSAADFPTYSIGHCAHCHEQHASIDGVEPTPADGPDGYLLFDTNYTDQTANFCFDCHDNTTTYAATAIVNRSYSYNFGGDTTPGSYDDDILEAFSHTGASGSSHHLPSIAALRGTTLQDADGNSWTLPENINPCDACHNPHIVQRNKNTTYDPTKSAISRPSDRSNRWGDDVTERMSVYSDYQAPYWYGSTSTYEPAGDGTDDGSNLPNYVKLCTDCHNDYNTIYSSNPRLPNGPRNLLKISWKTSSATVTPDAHGALGGTISWPRDPYVQYTDYTLCCTDCHEPHGSHDSIYLVRESINGADITVTDTLAASWESFCYEACHTQADHKDKSSCVNCHYHGGGKGGF